MVLANGDSGEEPWRLKIREHPGDLRFWREGHWRLKFWRGTLAIEDSGAPWRFKILARRTLAIEILARNPGDLRFRRAETLAIEILARNPGDLRFWRAETLAIEDSGTPWRLKFWRGALAI